MNMLLPKLLIFTLTFCKLIIHLDAKVCPKGHRIMRDRSCSPCPDGYYQPEENESQYCRPCTKCNEQWGSSVEQACTKETNTKCQCRAGFVPLESDASTCKCNIGFGLNDQECLKCKDGYFSDKFNSACQKWKECKSGVNKTGTRTSDVICNDLSDSDITTTFITGSTTVRPREEPQTQTTSTKTTTTTASPQHKGNPKEKVDSASYSNTGNYIGMALLIFGIVGLLILTAVTCKLHISPCMQKKTPVPTKESWSWPVEECGNGSLSSFKQSLEEP